MVVPSSRAFGNYDHPRPRPRPVCGIPCSAGTLRCGGVKSAKETIDQRRGMILPDAARTVSARRTTDAADATSWRQCGSMAEESVADFVFQIPHHVFEDSGPGGGGEDGSGSFAHWLQGCEAPSGAARSPGFPRSGDVCRTGRCGPYAYLWPRCA